MSDVRIEDRFYIDYAEDRTPDYSNEIWYQDVMSAYQSTKECSEF